MLADNVIILPPGQREKIMDYLPFAAMEVKVNDPADSSKEEAQHLSFAQAREDSVQHRARALLKVQEGCNHMCTFCIVPMVRGPLVSFTPEELIPKVKKLAEEGYREVVLTGTHLALWGRDSRSKKQAKAEGKPEQNFADLLEALIKNTQDVRFRISSIEPMSFPERILDLMIAYPDRLCPHLHLVIQHASDKILAAMHRDYTLAEYDNLAEKFLRKVPGACLTTDVLVGFPGETEEDMDILLNYLSRRKFYHLHVFPYSKRQGTVASELSNQVPEQVKKERVRKVIELGAQSAEDVYDSFANTTRKVLAERPSGHEGFLIGTADNFLTVEFPGKVSDIGKIMPIEIRRHNEF